MNIESAPLIGRGLVAPKKSFSSYVLRVVVIAMLFALIPMAPALAHTFAACGQPLYTGNTVGDDYIITATSDGSPATATLTATPIPGPNAQPQPFPLVQTTTAVGQVATFTLNSFNAGSSLLTVTIWDFHEESDNCTAEWAPGPPNAGQSTLEPSSDENDAGDPHTVTFTVKDALGNPVPGQDVTFTVTGTGVESDTSGGDNTENDTTDSEGQAEYTFTSNREGTSVITATTDGVTVTATKTWTASQVKHIHICDDEDPNADPDSSCNTSSTNDVNEPHTVTLTVHDEFGNIPPAGTKVTITNTFELDDDDDGDTDSTETVTRFTNEDGQVSYTFNSTKTGVSTIIAGAFWEGEWVTEDTPFTKEWDPLELDHYHIDFKSPQFAGICFAVTITAHDIFENQTSDGNGRTSLLVGSLDGAANLFFFPGGNCGGESSNNQFNIEGQRRIFAKDFDSNGETVFITAVSPGGDVDDTSGPLVIEGGTTEEPPESDPPAEGPCPGETNDECPPPAGEEPPPPPPGAGEPDDVDVDPFEDTNFVGEQHTVVATVTDSNGDPVSGVTVTWSTDGTGFESPSGATTFSDANGKATFTFTSSEPGRTTISAIAEGEDSAAQGFAFKNWIEEGAQLFDWFFMGGILVGGPDVSDWGEGRLDVFVRGADNALWHRYWDGTQWSAWERLGGILTSDPSAVAFANGRIDIFVRGADNALWHMYWNGLAWQPWEGLGGGLSSGPDAASWAPNRLDIFARGLDNAMWHMYWDGDSWEPWENLGGFITSDPGAVSRSLNTVDVFARGGDNALWRNFWNGTSWSGWQSLGGFLTSGPDAASWASNRMDVFVRGGDNALWQTTWNGSSWSGFGSLGGVLNSSPGATSWGTGRIDVFVQGTDRALWHKFFDNGTWFHESEQG